MTTSSCLCLGGDAETLMARMLPPMATRTNPSCRISLLSEFLLVTALKLSPFQFKNFSSTFFCYKKKREEIRTYVLFSGARASLVSSLFCSSSASCLASPLVEGIRAAAEGFKLVQFNERKRSLAAAENHFVDFGSLGL